MGLRETEVRVLDLREVPLAGVVDELTVERPREPVERADESGDPTSLVAQRGPAVETRVEIGLDLRGCRAYDDQRVVGDVVDDVITDDRDVLFAAGDLPDLAPDVLDLEAMPLRRVVALAVDVSVALVFPRLDEVLGRGRDGVVRVDIGRAVSRAAGDGRVLGRRHGASATFQGPGNSVLAVPRK